MEIPGQQICNLKLHIQNLSIAEDYCENESDSPINALSNDIWFVGVSLVLSYRGGEGGGEGGTTSISYSAKVCSLQVPTYFWFRCSADQPLLKYSNYLLNIRNTM